MKIFIINDNGNYIILNVDNETDCKNLKEQGVYEVPEQQANEIFGDFKHLASNENCSISRTASGYDIFFKLDLEKVLNDEKENKKREIDLMLNEELKKGFLYNNTAFQIDKDSLNAISQRANLLSVDDKAIINWIAKDNTIITFTNNEFKDFANQCLAYESDLKIKARVLKNQIEEIKTLKDLKAFKIGF